MKLTAGLNLLYSRDIEKNLSKKITLANTMDKTLDRKVLSKAVGHASDPIFFTNDSFSQPWNPDIRYRTDFAFSPMTNVNYRNDLLIFAENYEVKKAVRIVGNETVLVDTDQNKYPVFPKINQTLVEESKQQVADAIQDYLDKIFYPKLYQWYNFKDEGLLNKVKEYLITGKIAYEIIYDSLKHPKEIIGVMPIDPATLQKFRANGQTWYVQRPIVSDNSGANERVLHENQIILCEWNEYDFGYISYVDQLRRPFNVMRSMETSKVLWFAAKSQVRMHIKLALGDVTRPEAITKLTESKNQYINQFQFKDDGTVTFNNAPNNSGYREFFTAETAQSGSPEIEEVNANGPDLTETDSLNYWSRLFWTYSEIPFDRIDNNSGDTWGFSDVNSLRKIEINFAKFITSIRKVLNPLFIKPIVIQLTLKEAEVGVDLSLLDSIKMEWVAFNNYQELAELEVLDKRVQLAMNMANFGELTDVNGMPRKPVPLTWIMKTYLGFTKEQLDSLERERIKENLFLGFNADGSTPEGMGEDAEDEDFDEGDESDEDFNESDEDFGEDENFDEFDKDNEQQQEESLIDMVRSGEISQEEIGMLIDAGQLSDEEIQELKDNGLFPGESAEDIQNSEDDAY